MRIKRFWNWININNEAGRTLYLERAAWIDVLGCFLNLAFVGIYQWVFGHFPRKRTFKGTNQLFQISICLFPVLLRFIDLPLIFS
jgi:hypothetical protein